MWGPSTFQAPTMGTHEGASCRSVSSLRSRGSVPRAPVALPARWRLRAPSSGGFHLTLLHPGPGAAQLRLHFFAKGVPGVRSAAPGPHQAGSPHRPRPVALARPQRSALPEAPAHRGMKGRRSAPEPASRTRSSARPGSKSGEPSRIQVPPPGQEQSFGVDPPGDGTLTGIR
ncbi:hypothetical protein NDU88_004907 [Pleurodeles waltl]|uniref:Uncharacterized protein n=1 Tax=Pleurodeles waltl TaxID=8319 RepID=A0AAV7UH14_PLEWA|nr:hypothetical protein NDU88_004907 [Pleurodeles waltl]